MDDIRRLLESFDRAENTESVVATTATASDLEESLKKEYQAFLSEQAVPRAAARSFLSAIEKGAAEAEQQAAAASRRAARPAVPQRRLPQSEVDRELAGMGSRTPATPKASARGPAPTRKGRGKPHQSKGEKGEKEAPKKTPAKGDVETAPRMTAPAATPATRPGARAANEPGAEIPGVRTRERGAPATRAVEPPEAQLPPVGGTPVPRPGVPAVTRTRRAERPEVSGAPRVRPETVPAPTARPGLPATPAREPARTTTARPAVVPKVEPGAAPTRTAEPAIEPAATPGRAPSPTTRPSTAPRPQEVPRAEPGPAPTRTAEPAIEPAATPGRAPSPEVQPAPAARPVEIQRPRELGAGEPRASVAPEFGTPREPAIAGGGMRPPTTPPTPPGTTRMPRPLGPMLGAGAALAATAAAAPETSADDNTEISVPAGQAEVPPPSPTTPTWSDLETIELPPEPRFARVEPEITPEPEQRSGVDVRPTEPVRLTLPTVGPRQVPREPEDTGSFVRARTGPQIAADIAKGPGTVSPGEDYLKSTFGGRVRTGFQRESTVGDKDMLGDDIGDLLRLSGIKGNRP